MIISRSVRRCTAGGFAVSDVTNKVVAEVNCSVVLFGEPNSGQRSKVEVLYLGVGNL